MRIDGCQVLFVALMIHTFYLFNIGVIGALSISTVTTGTITVRIPLSVDPNKAILQRYNGDEY